MYDVYNCQVHTIGNLHHWEKEMLQTHLTNKILMSD